MHTIDFSGYQSEGEFVLVSDGQTSHPFSIGGNFYGRLRDDALKFYYTQRCGIEIRADPRPGYEPPAGYLGVAPNNLVVVASAYDITEDQRFAGGVVSGMGYLLGRNALNISYITGYGTVFSQNQHSRWYSHQLNPALPHPPVGSLAGGPNSSIQDPVAQQKLAGCIGQFCYIDDIESWATTFRVSPPAPHPRLARHAARRCAGGLSTRG